MRGHTPVRLQAQPNVTPMVDVMLVLLIIFMVITPSLMLGFVAEPPYGVHLTQHPEEAGDQVLGIDQHGQLYLNKKPIAEGRLLHALRQRTAEVPEDRVLYVLAHRSLEYRTVRDALDVAAEAGLVVAGLITEQRGDETLTPNR
jgi:biopolymer transport protein TolR